MATKFKYPVNLVSINIENQNQSEIRATLNNLPYLLYDVETLSNDKKILINKPGGKRNFGRLSKNDFMVFIYTPVEDELWLISHSELYEDIKYKLMQESVYGKEVIDLLNRVCHGEEPNKIVFVEKNIGLSIELLLKVYKWIWGQEDVNYPTKKGRWLSMDGLIELKNMY